ncbi:ArsR/SmtB family transcription factor [Thomasclavelia sp.]
MEKQYENETKIFKAFCDPNRLEILNILKTGEHCACKLLEILDVSQSTLSHHMKLLADAQIVTVRKDGKWSHYSLSKEGIQDAIEYLQQLQKG